MWCFGNGVWLFWNGLFRDCLQHSNIESYSLCCLWVNIKLLLINAARAVTKETGNTGQGYIFLKAVYCNHFRQTVDIFLLSLCVIHRHVARATTKGGVPRCAVVTFNCKSCTVLKTSPYRTVQQQLVTHLPRWSHIQQNSKTLKQPWNRWRCTGQYSSGIHRSPGSDLRCIG